MMGTDNGHGDAKPVHEVVVRTFGMSRTPVTVEQYAECVNKGQCTRPGTGDSGYCNWGKRGRQRHPVNHRNGGRRVFPFIYAYYRQVELGESLPRGVWLPNLVERLRVPSEPDALHSLLTDYLRDRVGSDDVFARLFSPMLHGPGAASSQSRAVSRILRRGAYQHTPEEFRALLLTPAVYWSHIYLTLERLLNTNCG